MSKQCPYCKSKKIGSFNDTVVCCTECHRVFGKSQLVDSTFFDRITQSPETLAETLVYCEQPEHQYSCASWRSVVLGSTSYARKSEAIAATVAKLKEVGE